MPRSYRVPIRVSALFELVRFLGIEQNAVGQHLGATKSHVSMWAHGTRPLTVRQGLPFIRFLASKLVEADQRAHAQSRPIGKSLLSQRTTYDDFRSKVNTLIARWGLELMRARGDITNLYREQVRLLETYLQQDLFKLPREELARIEEASREIQRCLRYVAQLEHLPGDRPWVDGPPAPDWPPVAYLWNIASIAGIHEEGHEG
jgi:predicted transcriptional regulator